MRRTLKQRFRKLFAGPDHDTAARRLLLLAIAATFAAGSFRDHLHQPGLGHDANTAAYMAQIGALSIDNGLLRVYREMPNPNGDVVVEPYNRFPVGSYVLLKLATLPFADDLGSQLVAARLAMLVFFSASAGLAFVSLRRLMAGPWIALAATLLAYSSYYLRFYSDMVSVETGPSLLGVMLAFHGMVVFACEGRLRQLLVKVGIALLLGWHVYALVLAFVALGVVQGVIVALRSRRAASTAGRARRVARAVLGGRHMALAGVALLLGGAVLTFNLATEARAVPAETFAELPSVRSLLRRTGIDDTYGQRAVGAHLAWGTFLENQFQRLGRTLLPYAVPWPGAVVSRASLIGVAGLGVCLLGLRFARHRRLWATLALAGFCWAVPMRYQTAFHSFEAVFYVGTALTAWAFLLLGARGLLHGRAAWRKPWHGPALASTAALVLALSAAKMSRDVYDREAAALHTDLAADFRVIRAVVKEGQGTATGSEGSHRHGRVVFVNQRGLGIKGVGPGYVVRFYLQGTVILFPKDGLDIALADYVIDTEQSGGVLTAGNRRVFLHDRAAYEAALPDTPLAAL